MELYSVKISDVTEEDIEKLYLLLDKDKRCRIKKIVHKKDRLRTLIGELLIRNIIIEKLGVQNRCINFSKNQYDKPYIIGYPEFNFNISHSGDYVVCVTDNKLIGIDIEQIKPIKFKEISRKFFTLNECKYIFDKSSNNQLERFYEIWTLKESYIKCCGRGLSIALNSFSVDIDKDKCIKVLVNNEYMKNAFKLFDFQMDYKVTICSQSMKISNNIIDINQVNLINAFFSKV